MLCVQVGAAASTPVFAAAGPLGTTWLRLSWAALILLLLVRPDPRRLARADLRAAMALGFASAIMTLSFFQAVDRIPLGTAVAIELLGPLAIAAARGHGRGRLGWPTLAAAGVVPLTGAWTGDVEVVGLAYALVAALGWAAYLLLTARVGAQLSGLQGLAISMPVAAACAAVVGWQQAAGHLTALVLAQTLALAVILPLMPWSLELIALRRTSAAAFGTLMSVEPALALIVGAILLAQTPTPQQVLGIVCVVLAAAGAARAERPPPTTGMTPRAPGLALAPTTVQAAETAKPSTSAQPDVASFDELTSARLDPNDTSQPICPNLTTSGI